MRTKVAAVFGMAITPASSAYPRPTVTTTELTADFDSQETLKAVWGTGAASADHPMDCGMAKYNGVAIGAVQSSNGAATIPVVLYEGGKAGTVAISVTLDPASGVINGFSCTGAPDLTKFPGIAPIAAYYGAMATMDSSVLNDPAKPYFTPAFSAWQPADSNYDDKACSQSVPDQWVIALTGTTSAASAWDFAPNPVRSVVDPAAPMAPIGFPASLAVDLGSTKISRVTCEAVPAADTAHPADYVQSLMSYYRLAADQKSLGVDSEAALRPFFASDAAFTSAWTTTGPVPLLCANKVPGSVMTANGSTATTAGGQTTVKMVTWPMWHADAPGQEVSKFTVTVDANTLKIASITCAK